MLILSRAIQKTYDTVRDLGVLVEPTRWQSMDVSKRPEAATREVLNHTFKAPIHTEDLDDLREQIAPNLPWADDHFLERVGGKPLNPGIEWAHWPWGNSANSFRQEKVPTSPTLNPSKEADMEGYAPGFSHTYMERMWPKKANGGVKPHRGVRYEYGDAMDVVAHLAKAPDSRQAYLPIWFPEDTGKLDVRVPCTLGYHFIQRHGYLHCVYYISSCDLYRHFRDDVYLTVRLQLWVLDQLRMWGGTQDDAPRFWAGVKPGTFTMHITSLHCFVNDARLLWPKKVW
jgi:hypothetical protein